MPMLWILVDARCIQGAFQSRSCCLYGTVEFQPGRRCSRRLSWRGCSGVRVIRKLQR